MEFNYLDIKDCRNLVKDMFILSFNKEDLPYKTIVLPLGLPAIIYVFNKQTTIIKGTKKNLQGLQLFGQFYGGYDYLIDIEGINIGINFNATSLYKILHKNISLYTNQHLLLADIHKELASKIELIFIKNKNNIPNLKKEILQFIDTLNLKIDNEVNTIDIAVNYILENEGLIHISDLINLVHYSQKSLEVKFKKIVGLTPGKFIKMIRFNNLMAKYQNKKIDLNDLIYMYDYYDQSHFKRDFKLFMKQNPKDFFYQEYPLLKKYLSPKPIR